MGVGGGWGGEADMFGQTEWVWKVDVSLPYRVRKPKHTKP